MEFSQGVAAFIHDRRCLIGWTISAHAMVFIFKKFLFWDADQPRAEPRVAWFNSQPSVGDSRTAENDLIEKGLHIKYLVINLLHALSSTAKDMLLNWAFLSKIRKWLWIIEDLPMFLNRAKLCAFCRENISATGKSTLSIATANCCHSKSVIFRTVARQDKQTAPVQ